MNLKEAFRYQNFLDALKERLVSHLYTSHNVMKITQDHFRKKANPEAEDEMGVDASVERGLECSVNTLIDLALCLVDEKEKLCKAIDQAKIQCEFDLDAATSTNTYRHSFGNTLSAMARLQSQERVLPGRGYKLTVDGTQVPYVYDIKEVTTIDFDRNKAKVLAKKLMTQADEVSNELDLARVKTVVDYSPLFDVNDSFEEIVEQFAEQNQ